MISATDKNRIGRSFHRHAAEYDRFASVQKRVVTRLEHLITEHLRPPPQCVLDIGCGTGALLAALRGSYPHSWFCGLDLAFNMARRSAVRFDEQVLLVNGDAEQLPFRDEAFDLVVSASTFQWFDRIEAGFRESLRVLQGNGLVCIAFFGGRTLWELQECYREAVTRRYGSADARQGRMQRFRDRIEIQRVMSSLGCEQVIITDEIEMEYHADVPDLLRSIKSIGAATAAGNNRSGGLGWRAVLTDMAGIYRERFQENGMIPASYEVIYVVARKGRPIRPVPR